MRQWIVGAHGYWVAGQSLDLGWESQEVWTVECGLGTEGVRLCRRAGEVKLLAAAAAAAFCERTGCGHAVRFH